MRAARQLFSLLALLACAACSPALDWREYRVPEGGFVVLFPQKPAQSERRLSTPAGDIVMHMLSVRVGEHVLAAGYADFARPVDAALIEAMRDALAANIGAQASGERRIASGAVGGREFSATGSLGRGKDARSGVLRARVYAHGRRYFQLVSIGSAEGMAAADVDLFLGSFKPD